MKSSFYWECLHKKFEEWCHDSPGMTDCNMAQSLLEGHIEYTGKKEHDINKVFPVREREREYFGKLIMVIVIPWIKEAMLQKYYATLKSLE